MSKVDACDTNMIIFGLPGSGKGTQSARIAHKKNMVHLSTGDVIRKAVQDQTQQGLAAKNFMDKGELVPDKLVDEMLSQELDHCRDRGFILDGYPRNLEQAKTLDIILREKKMSINKILFLEVPEEMVISRLSGRRVCDQCEALFHISDNPPQKKEGQCDFCQGTLIQRHDDVAEVIQNRLGVYREKTLPLKEYYQGDSSRFFVINAQNSPEEVFQEITKAIS